MSVFNPMPDVKFDEGLSELQAAINGSVLVPGSPEYDQARRGWNLSVEQLPALIVAATSREDVLQAVRFARRNSLNVAVQSTGHGAIRPADGDLLILTSAMTGIQVDPDRQTVRVAAGVKWGMVLEKTQPFGLSPLLGSSPGVGVVGYTLGGGMGWLARKYGMAADSLLDVELVTGDGALIHANASENSDLFWGLRGGGGNFGVVTSLEFKLFPVSTVYGGNLYYPAEMAREVMARYRDWVATLPDEMTTSIVVMNYPSMPQLPPALSGKSFVIVRGCFTGPVELGEKLIEAWRSWRTPAIDEFKTMPFSQVASISNDPPNPMPVFMTGTWLSELADEAIDQIVRYGLEARAGLPLMFIEVRHAGGAIARLDASASAYSSREALFNLVSIGLSPSPEVYAGLKGHTDRLKLELSQYLTGSVYLNFLDGAEARRRTKQAYAPEVFRRLQDLKLKFDPQNVFRFSFDLAGLDQ
jgi:FAD binding domain/Berberine and berberine like